jgi:WD40 repeat protein
MVALATSNGVAIIPDFCNGREGGIHRTRVQGEQMVVEFKDERVVMSGTRSGRLNLCDTRSLDASSSVACRIQHSSAISGLAMLPDGYRVLVSGLSDMKIYDLRFAQAPSPLSRGSSRKANKTRAANYEHTKPALTFNVPQSRRQNQYGLGFAYDPELNTVVRASTDFVSNHRVGIWSANSGQLLSSPLNEHKFAAPVTCAEIVRVRDGPKSILLATDGEIQEWCAQGRGF